MGNSYHNNSRRKGIKMTLIQAFRYLLELVRGEGEFSFVKLLDVVLIIGNWVRSQLPNDVPGIIPLTAPTTEYTDAEVEEIANKIDTLNLDPSRLALFGFDKTALMFWVLKKVVEVIAKRAGS